MESVCSMVNCYNSVDDVISCQFFQFPKDFDLCMQWVQNCGRTELFEDFAYSGAQPFVDRVVCSEHFQQSDFIDPSCINKGLKSNAIPICKTDLPTVIKKECRDECSDSAVVSSAGTYFIESERVLNFVKDDEEEAGVDLNPTQFSHCDERKEYKDVTCLPLVIVLNDTVSSTCSQKSQRAFQAAWKRALESVEERETRNRANALRNAHKRANETEEQRKARNLANASRNAHRRASETEEQRKDRLYKNAVRTAIRRSMESEVEQNERRRRNALRAAFRRSTETEELKAQRRLKDKLRSAERRQQESELQSKIRKYNDAVRAAFRRNNESDEQKQQRRIYDVIRAAQRRSNESLEQRIKRLKADRERAAKRRLLKKLNTVNVENSLFSDKLESDLDNLNLKCRSIDKGDELKQKNNEVRDNKSAANFDLNEADCSRNTSTISNNLDILNVTADSNLISDQHLSVTLSPPEVVWCT